MRIQAPARITLVTIAMVLAPGIAGQALAKWSVKSGQGRTEAVAFSQAPGGILVIACVQQRSIWLTFHPPKGWNGNQKAGVRAGDRLTPVVIDGGDGALFSNRPDGQMGITRSLLDDIRAAKTVTIEGPATARVPAPLRSFSGEGAAGAIAAVERSCPGFR